MAFGFFRRRQKMVVIIMAVLMVSFLVGFQGLQMLVSKSPRDVAVGTTSEGELTRKHVWSAQADLSILRMLRLGDADAYGRPTYATGGEFLMLTSPGQRDPALAYALLLVEAKREGVTVSDADVQEFIAKRLGLTQASYRGLLAAMRRAQRGISDGRVRGALKNWLMIHRAFVGSLVLAPPSERRVRHVARDVLEKIRLRVLRIPAEKFLDEVPDPNDKQVSRQLAEYRDVPAGVYPTVNSFGFGYLVPAQVRIRYALVRRDAIRRAARPSEKEIYDYYDAHKSELVDENGKRKTIAGAWGEIVEALRDRAAAEIMDRMVGRMRQLAAEYSSRPGRAAGGHAYLYAKDRMTADPQDVDAILGRRINVRIAKAPIERALDALAEQAGIHAICYPYGRDGKEFLDPNVLVTIEGRMTLGEALKELSRQARWPEVRWGSVEGLERALFPLGDADFPIVVKETPAMDARRIAADEVLGLCVSRSGQSLAALAFGSEPFVPPERRTPGMLAIGQEGPTMTVLGQRGGTLLWRLVAARRAHVPEKFTDEMKRQARADLKIRAAFAKAYQAARKIDTTEKFEAAVAGKEYPTMDTGWLTRKQQPLAGPLEWSRVEAVELPPDPGAAPQARRLAQAELRKAFLELAFSPALLPENVEPPFEPKSKSMAVMRVPARREVLVLRRIGYQPLVKSTYQKHRAGIFRLLMARRMQISAATWFDVRSVGTRVQFERAGR